MDFNSQTPAELAESPFIAKWKNKKLDTIAKRMKELAVMRKELEDQATLIYKEWDCIRKMVIPRKLEEMGLEKATVTGVGTVGLRGDMFSRTVDKEGLADWLRAHEAGDLIQPTVNGSTLKSFLKELIEKGEELPDDDLVAITPYTYAVITK